MAKIILKSRYLKKGSLAHSENLIKYIAKRDGVQKIDDTWKESPATKEQQKLIAEIIKDFPDAKDSLEYEDYLSFPSKGTASEFITRAIEENADLIGKRENYVEYKIYNSSLQQRHLRKTHCYFWVFQKCKGDVNTCREIFMEETK